MVRQLQAKIPIYQSLVAVLVGLGVLLVLFPIIWMIFGSMRPVTETFGNPPAWIPHEITWDAYERLLSDPQQVRFQLNTYIVALSTALLSVGLGSLAAYGFSRYRILGGQLILLAILALQMLPTVSVIIPFFKMAFRLGFFDTYLTMILADTVFALPISVWMLKGYVDSIPTDVEEAALVDGCSRLQVLYRIVMPLMLPGLVGTATFAFLYAWNDFVFASVLRESLDLAPVTVAIARFFTQHNRDWPAIMALNTIATLPLVAIFVFLQRYVVQGLTAGAVK